MKKCKKKVAPKLGGGAKKNGLNQNFSKMKNYLKKNKSNEKMKNIKF